jgi:hypothetical protein
MNNFKKGGFMIRYGKNDCVHEWAFRKDGYEQQCVPTICIKCGAFGCLCDALEEYNLLSMTNKEIEQVTHKILLKSYNSFDNINNRWENPYVKK